jgi:hypothetical protein
MRPYLSWASYFFSGFLVVLMGASSRPQKLLKVSELTAASEAELGLKNT